MSKHRDEISQELWCRVYAAAISKYVDGHKYAIEAADKAVENFDKRYPMDTSSSDYGYKSLS